MPEPKSENTELRQDSSETHNAAVHTNASRSDEEEEFEAFYRHNYTPTLRYVLSHASNVDAEAIVADAYLLAWNHFLTHGVLSRPWLFTVVKNKLGDHYRSTARRQAATPEFEPVADPAVATNLKIDIDRVLQRLKSHHREALVMAYWFDLPTADAAELLGISHIAYRVRLTRAKRAFLHHLEGQREAAL